MTDKIISERGSGRVEIARREGGRGRPTPRERPRQAGDEKAWPPGTPPPSPAGAPSTVGSGRQGISGEGHPAASAGSRPARASSGGGRVGHRVNEERRTRQVRGKENATMAPPPRASIKHGRWVTAESDVAFGVHEARGATTSRRKDPPLRSGAAVTPGRRRAAGAAVWTTTEITRRRRATGPRAVAGAASRPQPVPSPTAGTGGSSDGGRKERIRIRKEATGLCGWNHARGAPGAACVHSEGRPGFRGAGGVAGRGRGRRRVLLWEGTVATFPGSVHSQRREGRTSWGDRAALCRTDRPLGTEPGRGPGAWPQRSQDHPIGGRPRRAARGGSRVPVGQSAWRQGCPEGGSGNPGWTRRKGG